MILTALMAHPRKLIRHAVVALLIAANTAAGARVKPTRVEPNKPSQLPALGVYTLNDPVDEDNSTETENQHELELEVVAWVGHSDDYSADDRMDDIAEQVEAAMRVDPTFDGEAMESTLVGSTMQVVEENGSTSPHTGIIVLTYAVKYRSSKVADGPVDDFVTVGTTEKLVGGVADTVPSTQVFNVQEPTP